MTGLTGAVAVLLLVMWAEAAQSIRIWGNVRLRGDGPQAAVRIRLEGPDLTTFDTYSRDGRFEFHNVPPGPYEVWLQAPGYRSSTQTIVVLGSQEFTFELRSAGK
jgi:hypothetical protein